MKEIILVIAMCILLAGFCFSQGAQEAGKSAQSSHIINTPDEIKWSQSGPGSAVAILSGSPDKEGVPFVLRLKFKDGAKIPPHWHPVDEQVTVISGTFFMGMGEKFDETLAREMPTGSYGFMPKEMRHFAWVKGETIIQIHGIGPFKAFWVKQPEK